MVEHDRLEDAIASLDLEQLMIKIRNIEGKTTGFKIGETRRESTDLDGFLKSNSYNIRGLARDINEYDEVYADDLSAARSDLTKLHDSLQGMNSSLDLSGLEDAYKPLGRPKPDVLDEISALDDEELDDYLEDLSSVVNRARDCESVWEFLDIQRDVGRMKYSQWSEIHSALSDFVDELDTVEQDLKNTIKELEEEAFDPDKTPYEGVRTESQKLVSELGEDL
jgi:uncharacterized protein YukE